jgi:hypothetical protein
LAKLITKAIVKKEVSTTTTSISRGRSIKEADRRRLTDSIPLDAHRGLRMLCADELIETEIICDLGQTEFACANMTDIRLDVTKLQGLVNPIIGFLVNEDGSK